jgi:hypothetical protein
MFAAMKAAALGSAIKPVRQECRPAALNVE